MSLSSQTGGNYYSMWNKSSAAIPVKHKNYALFHTARNRCEIKEIKNPFPA